MRRFGRSGRPGHHPMPTERKHIATHSVVTSLRSGAQTGADQGGLAAALILGLEPGGWVPKGRRTDAGPLTDEQMLRWRLKEHPSSGYPGRTEQNVREADLTVWFGRTTSPGYRCTANAALRWTKPLIANPTVAQLRELATQYRIWNIAGNRERTNPGIYQHTLDILTEALS